MMTSSTYSDDVDVLLMTFASKPVSAQSFFFGFLFLSTIEVSSSRNKRKKKLQRGRSAERDELSTLLVTLDGCIISNRLRSLVCRFRSDLDTRGLRSGADSVPVARRNLPRPDSQKRWVWCTIRAISEPIQFRSVIVPAASLS